ncbi:MAG: phage/plasmid primase, P4 family [Phycisphaerae bacterium]
MTISETEIVDKWARLTGQAPKRVGREWLGLCPVHERDGSPHRPSLNMRYTDDGMALFQCRSKGCESAEIYRAIVGGSEPHHSNGHAHRPAGRANAAASKPKKTYPELAAAIAGACPPEYTHVDTYAYRDAGGVQYAAVARYNGAAGKTIRPFARCEDGWFCGDPPKWQPYRVNEVLSSEVVYVHEGEKCADRGAMLDLPSVTSAHGAKSAAKTDWSELAGKRIVILPDNDDAGRAYAADVAAILHSLGCKIKIITLPELPEHGDICDWLDAQPDSISPEQLADDIVELAGAAPFWEPPAKAAGGGADEDVHLTDTGNGIRFANRHGKNIRMVAGIGWHVWDGRRWQFDDTGEVERLAKETCRACLTEAVNAPGMKDKDRVMHWMRTESVSRLKAMIELAISEPGITIRAAELDADPWLLNVENGILNLRDGTLRPHDPAALMSKLAPVTFDPAASCPRFDRFIGEVFNSDADTRMYVMKLLGICLTGDITEQILPIFWGEGANGKSTLLATVAHILGDYAGTAPESLLAATKREEHPCELADLQGKRLIVAAETESGARLRMQLIKRLTGEETIKARRMRENFYEFTRVHKIILQTNNRPRVNENSEAVWRRLKLVPFTVTFSRDKQDKNLPAKLKAEASGILNRLIEGCLLWQKEGLREPDAVKAATGDFREESDPLQEFLEQCCERVSGAWTATSDLFVAYVRHCEGIAERPLGHRQFTDALGRHGFTPRRTNRERGWDGVTLRDGRPV